MTRAPFPHVTPASPIDAPEAPSAPLAEYLDHAPAPSVERVLLPSGRKVEVTAEDGRERVVVVGRDNTVELTVVLTERGPRLVFEAAEMEFRATGAVSVDCARFDVRAREEATVTAGRAAITATRTDVDLRANDNVIVVGEQVRLNCDKPDVVPAWMQRVLAARAAGGAPVQPEAPAQVTGDASLFEALDRERLVPKP